MPAASSPSITPVAADGATASPGAPAAGGWLSPEGALTGEFGELVEDIPAKPTAVAPVFPTPPAPWPAVSTPIAATDVVAPDAFFAGADIDAELAAPAAPTGSASGAPDASASRGDAGFGTWTPETSELASPHEATEIPGVLDTSATEGEVWADAFGAEADAIHGLDATSQAGAESPPIPEGSDAGSGAAIGAGGRVSNWWEAESTASGLDAAPSEARGYLAAEWPEPSQAPDPSTLPTPVLGVAALDSSWTGQVPETAMLPRAMRDEAAGVADEGVEHGAGQDSWEFAPAAASGGSLHAQPTSSSLAAAEALELIAVQLRNGTLRADGYSPALGEAAALSAVLAALLGIDARWDVPR